MRVEMTFRRLVHRRRHRRTTSGKEGWCEMASHGIKDRVAIVGMGCTRFVEHWDLGPRRPPHRRRQRGVRVGGHRQGRGRRLLARHRAGRHERHHARPPAAAREQAGHARRELLRHRCRGAAAGVVRGGVGRVRRRDGDRRREDQGLRLPGPRRGDRRRTTAPRARSPRRRCSRWSRPRTPTSSASTPTSCARRWRTSRGRTTTTARATRVRSSGARCRWRRSARRRRWPATLGVFDCAGVADGAAAAIVCRAEDAHRYTDKPLFVKALSFVAGNGGGLTDPDVRLHDVPRGRGVRARRVRAGGHHRPARRARARRGARLLHHHRAGAHGGPRVLGARRGVARRDRRRVRPRRRAAGQPRRRAEVVRPPGRRVGPAHDVRGVAAAPRRGARRARRSTQPDGKSLALTHNLGGYPGEMVSFVSILGR